MTKHATEYARLHDGTVTLRDRPWSPYRRAADVEVHAVGGRLMIHELQTASKLLPERTLKVLSLQCRDAAPGIIIYDMIAYIATRMTACKYAILSAILLL